MACPNAHFRSLSLPILLPSSESRLEFIAIEPERYTSLYQHPCDDSHLITDIGSSTFFSGSVGLNQLASPAQLCSPSQPYMEYTQCVPVEPYDPSSVLPGHGPYDYESSDVLGHEGYREPLPVYPGALPEEILPPKSLCAFGRHENVNESRMGVISQISTSPLEGNERLSDVATYEQKVLQQEQEERLKSRMLAWLLVLYVIGIGGIAVGAIFGKRSATCVGGIGRNGTVTTTEKTTVTSYGSLTALPDLPNPFEKIQTPA